MKSILYTLAILLVSMSAFAQGNLVPNYGFEDPEKKIKEAGSIELAEPWVSLTDNKPDLFNPRSKGEDWGVPSNVYGEADPFSGEGYAGVVMYSYKDAEPRTYLQVKLYSPLEEEKVYCVKMHVMLAMLSKYSCNNLGIYLSEKPIDLEALEADAITPQIQHSQNRIFEDQFVWEPICQSFIATGGERYLTIGNFAPTSETTEGKVKKPKGITGQQTRNAYYYIDEVSVINMAGLDECDCEVDASGSALKVQYSKEVSSDMEVDVTADIQMSRIYFDETSTKINEDNMVAVTKVAKLLKEHPKYKVKIIGHTDPVEEAKVTGDVSQQRAQSVKDKLVELGAYPNKILVVGVQDFDPATDDVTPAGQAQNRRVVFEVISKE
ncbi:MAG: OmpA family protein [Cryomorphaceae bacterium]